MSTAKTTYDDPTVGVEPIARDQARELLGQVMGYLGRDLSGGTGLLLFIPAFACIFGLNIAAAKGREQLNLFGGGRE